MKRFLVFLVACSWGWTSACADSIAADLRPSIGPTRDAPSTRHLAIGALLSEDGFFCSATLIAPRKVLTAAHCLHKYTAVAFAIGPDAYHPVAVFGVSAQSTHPGYDDNIRSRQSDTYLGALPNDIGLVTLSEDVLLEGILVTPLSIATHADASVVGRRLAFVGYGYHSPYRLGLGQKRTVTMQVVEFGDTQFAHAVREHNICGGDSGGPALIWGADGQAKVAGVSSYTDVRCLKFGVSTRVDRFLRFLRTRPSTESGNQLRPKRAMQMQRRPART